MWTYIEYYAHRFLLHNELKLDPSKEADGDKLARIFTVHIHHHVFMNQRHRMVIPPKITYKVLLVVGAFGYFFLPTVMLITFLTGVLGGVLLYDTMHLAFHFDDVLPSWFRNTYWFQSMKAAHMRHHFRHNDREFGVTIDLWDRIYGTQRNSQVKSVE